MSEEAGVSIKQFAQQGRQGTRTANIFLIFLGKEKKRYALPAGQMERAVKRSGGVGKRCQNMRQEVNHVSERQEILRGMLEDNQDAEQSNRKYYDQIFEEMKVLEEKESEEALLLVQEKFVSWRFQNERDEARSLQRSGTSRRVKMEADSQDFLSVQSCRSSAVDHVEDIRLEPSRKRQDVQGVTSEFCREGNERKRRRCVETGTRRGKSGFARRGRRQRGP